MTPKITPLRGYFKQILLSKYRKLFTTGIKKNTIFCISFGAHSYTSPFILLDQKELSGVGRLYIAMTGVSMQLQLAIAG